jgi:glycerol kinase
MRKYIIAIDQSTSATKAILFDDTGSLLGRVNCIHKQYYPKSGWVEQDASEIFSLTCEAIKKLIGNVRTDPKSFLALAITNQTGAFVIWDKHTGDPVYPVIGWQCDRGDEISKMIPWKQKSKAREKCGINLSAFSVGPKLKWVLDNVEGLRKRAQSGELLFGTMESYLIWKLTAGKVHATDYCNASNTNLLNISSLYWDKDMLNLFDVPECMLPELKNADADFGIVDTDGLPHLQITGVMGDSAAALFSHCGFEKGYIKATYGTGASILMNLGEKVCLAPDDSMDTTIGWRMGANDVIYNWEGTAMYVGNLIELLVNNLGLMKNATEAKMIAQEAGDAAGVYLVPTYEGRLNLIGMNCGTKKAHIIRAAEESIAYQVKDIFDLIVRKNVIIPRELYVDGGPSKDDFLMQFQTDILNIPIIRSELEESSALGVAYMAGLSTGLFRDKDELRKLKNVQKKFEPRMSERRRSELLEGWKQVKGRFS